MKTMFPYFASLVFLGSVCLGQSTAQIVEKDQPKSDILEGKGSCCDDGCCATCCGVKADAKNATKEKLTQKIISLMNEAQSPNKFIFLLDTLMKLEPEPAIALPAILEKAEHLGLLDQLGDRLVSGNDEVKEKSNNKASAFVLKSLEEAIDVLTKRAADNPDHEAEQKSVARILPPISREVTAKCEQPPDKAEILQALPPDVLQQIHAQHLKTEDIDFTVERLVDKVDVPRFYPLIGPAQLHHCHWKCTVSYIGKTEHSYPFPFQVFREQTKVVFIDKDHLHLYSSEQAHD